MWGPRVCKYRACAWAPAWKTRFNQLDAPVENLVQAQCRDGSLFVPKQESGPFKTMAGVMMDSYHGLDYALFYMDIHENAKLRVSTYLKSRDDQI